MFVCIACLAVGAPACGYVGLDEALRQLVLARRFDHDLLLNTKSWSASGFSSPTTIKIIDLTDVSRLIFMTTCGNYRSTVVVRSFEGDHLHKYPGRYVSKDVSCVKERL